MTPTHAISADEARRLLAEDRAEFEWRLRLAGTEKALWARSEEIGESFRRLFNPSRLPSFGDQLR